MPKEMQRQVRRGPRFLCNHNPLYLVSAWLVLHGIGQAFQGNVGLRWMPLMTQLLCGYTLALALAGWLVVRVGKVWEDARMILLVLLLMFTGLSTSYDDQCLKDPVAGAQHLAFGFAFSCAITELVLFSLGMKLPLRYRAPFYLQLAVLFAFPAWLGKLSMEGRDPAMGIGVLIFPVAAAAALLCLLPAASGAPERDNGTPWPWPFYPWSIFVFMAIASGIRSWMLSVSFSPAAGVGPAFLPYFLCPILLSMLVIVLEMGLRRQSKSAQWIALVAMLGVVWMAFPGDRLNNAQRLLLNLMEGALAGPPLLVCGSVAVIAVYAMLRRAAGSELVALIALSLLACIDFDTRGAGTIHPPSNLALLALAGWQFGYGLWSRTTLRLAFGGIAMLMLLSRTVSAPWFLASNACWSLGIVWCVILPLICRDALAEWLRTAGPVLIALAATWMVTIGPTVWQSATVWMFAADTTALAILSLLYWVRLGSRWYVLTSAWSAAMASLPCTAGVLGMLEDAQLKRGLIWYAAGCQLLAAALLLSLWKAGVVRHAWIWLQQAASNSEDNKAKG